MRRVSWQSRRNQYMTFSRFARCHPQAGRDNWAKQRSGSRSYQCPGPARAITYSEDALSAAHIHHQYVAAASGARECILLCASHNLPLLDCYLESGPRKNVGATS